jgi:hypothetical protein
MTKSLPSCCLSFAASEATSPATMDEWVQSAFFKVLEKTYFLHLIDATAVVTRLMRKRGGEEFQVFRPISIASLANHASNEAARDHGASCVMATRLSCREAPTNSVPSSTMNRIVRYYRVPRQRGGK